jgi:hypothetical protein
MKCLLVLSTLCAAQAACTCKTEDFPPSGANKCHTKVHGCACIKSLELKYQAEGGYYYKCVVDGVLVLGPSTNTRWAPLLITLCLHALLSLWYSATDVASGRTSGMMSWYKSKNGAGGAAVSKLFNTYMTHTSVNQTDYCNCEHVDQPVGVCKIRSTVCASFNTSDEAVAHRPSYQGWAQDLYYSAGAPVSHVGPFADPKAAGRFHPGMMALRILLNVLTTRYRCIHGFCEGTSVRGKVPRSPATEAHAEAHAQADAEAHAQADAGPAQADPGPAQANSFSRSRLHVAWWRMHWSGCRPLAAEARRARDQSRHLAMSRWC